MQDTEQNCRIADVILTMLAKENCTARQATEILHYVGQQVQAKSVVQYERGSITPCTG